MSDDGAMVRVVVEGEFEGMEGERTQKRDIRNIVPHVKFWVDTHVWICPDPKKRDKKHSSARQILSGYSCLDSSRSNFEQKKQHISILGGWTTHQKFIRMDFKFFDIYINKKYILTFFNHIIETNYLSVLPMINLF